MITHCKESKWLPMEWIGGQRIMAEHRWKIDVCLGVITPLGGSLLIYHTNSKCFNSDEEVTGRNDCDWTEEESRRLPPITTHAIECLLMDKCTPCQRAMQHPTGYSSLSKCGDRCIDESHHCTDILITWTTSSSIGYREMDRLWACSLWKTGLHFFFFFLSVMGDKGKPTHWKSTPPFCWFPDKDNDNNFLTIWCLLHPPVAIQTKRKKKKLLQYGLKSLFWPHNLFS